MIPLTLRSHYSLMWGTASVRNLCRHAKKLGYQKLALTDTDNLYGLWPFLSACREFDLTPVIGAEVTDRISPWRAICLVKNLEGYGNLCSLLTRRHRDTTFSLKQDLPQFGKGLIVLTQSPSFLKAWHDHQGMDLGAALPRSPLSRTHALCRAAEKRNIPLVATPGSFFLNPGDHSTHAMLRAIDKNTCISRLSPGNLAPKKAFLSSPGQYIQQFAALPQAIKNTWKLGEKLHFQGPDFGIVMPPYKNISHGEANTLLRDKAFQGALGRYGASLPGKVIQRIDHELTIIAEKNFSSYFLVVEDIVKRASRICGRGSGAASIVAYCLGITNVCPIKFNLYFERFLNPGRLDPPDIDIDFAWDERDRILNQVLDQFSGHSAMVSSHILFQPRMAVREVAKVFGLPEGEIAKVSARLPWFWNQEGTETPADLLDRIKTKPEFKDMDFPQPWPQIMAYAQAIIGIPRYLSVHPGGIVITPQPIDRYVPVETAPKGIPLIQWEKDSTETAGLVKIDLLGNRSLGVIRDCITSITKTRGQFNDFSHQDPEDDLDTQHQVAQGHTMGCFYIESPAMRLLQKKSQIGDFRHVVIHSSIIRPAANHYIQEYIKRLHTGIWEPIHPLMEDLLDETFGIMVYQEDVSRVAVRLAGFTHAQADGLRKIMSKKDKIQALSAYYHQFSAGASARGITRADIQRIWDMIISFSGYSFCKPHSASYARVSFQAAYLKTHYPAQFMAGVISNQGGFYSTFAYVSEARRMGVKVLGPDIHASQIQWIGKDLSLRVGLMSIKNLSSPTMDRILLERAVVPFSSAQDFFTRVRPREDEIQALVYSGSLDSLQDKKSRAALLWSFTAWQRIKPKTEPSLLAPSLFDIPLSDPGQTTPLPELPPDPPIELLRQEFSALGFLCACHPICLFSREIKGKKTVKANDLYHHVGRQICFAGWLITGKVVRTKHGDPMKFLTFEDETGIVETVFFPKPYAQFCHLLDYGKPYFLTGRVESDWGAVTLTVSTTQLIARESTKM